MNYPCHIAEKSLYASKFWNSPKKMANHVKRLGTHDQDDTYC